MSRCGPWHYRSKKSRWRECREMHMTAEDRAWMIEHSELNQLERDFVDIRFRSEVQQNKAAFIQWADRLASKPYAFPVIDEAIKREWNRQSLERERMFLSGRTGQPEQYGISDDTNERARRLIESALGENNA